MVYDLAIVGGGPAGLSAALTALQRNKSVILFEHLGFSPKLSKSHLVENYLGLPKMSGKELIDKFVQHVKTHEATIVEEKIINIYPGDEFTLISGNNAYQAQAVVFATGAATSKALQGEGKFLGRGVSYCATCDGMIFKGKNVAVIASLPESEEEIGFLAEICQKVYLFPLYKGEYPKYANLEVVKEIPQEILGQETVETLKTDKNQYKVDGIFIFHATVHPDSIIPGLEFETNFIKVDKDMKTNVAGFFAAGDCTGQPWQISRATGQGQLAALSAVSYLDKKHKA